MEIKLGKYLFDKEKFILSVHNGDIYKTRYTSSEVINNNDYLLISSKLSYKISIDFIIENLEELKKKGIVKLK